MYSYYKNHFMIVNDNKVGYEDKGTLYLKVLILVPCFLYLKIKSKLYYQNQSGIFTIIIFVHAPKLPYLLQL